MSIATQHSIPKFLASCFGTHGGFRQQTPDPVTLIRHAELARAHIQRYARDLAEEIGLPVETSVKMGPIKTLSRIWEKAIGKYQGQVEKICDICRERLLISSPDDVLALRRMFDPRRENEFSERWKGRGIHPVEFEDYFAKPSSTGFRGINIKLAVDMGKGRYHVCELQVVHKDMLKTLDITHVLFEEIRTLEGAAAAKDRDLSAFDQDKVREMKEETIRLHEEDAVALGLKDLEIPQANESVYYARRSSMQYAA